MVGSTLDTQEKSFNAPHQVKYYIKFYKRNNVLLFLFFFNIISLILNITSTFWITLYRDYPDFLTVWIFVQRQLHISTFIIILTAILVYFDAKNINAGGPSLINPRDSRIISWTPILWAVVVFFFWIIAFPLYIYKRKAIFEANRSNNYPKEKKKRDSVESPIPWAISVSENKKSKRIKKLKLKISSFELEGETNKKYYIIMRFIFFCYVILSMYIIYELALLDYPGSKLFYYSLLGILFIILIIFFFLINYSILIHSLKRRKIVIDDNKIQYFIGDRLKEEISLENIYEIKIQRYCLSRLTPWLLTFTETYSEKNILISYKEKSKIRKLRLYFVDFLPAKSLDRLYEHLKNVSNYFSYEMKDRSKSLSSIIFN